ncbi:hypothetical protein MN116_004314 [Schistosoma mekongi]|uniref:Dentin sialophosphoprotein-like n=1 Tax=Schistosoma mekongi TaxID=38744 RepID=A0AAE1ZFY3_SCHME|nr:hypothetical protein MN116_004314 [Schistosoma mekongi]
MIPTIKLLSLICLLSYVKANVLPVSPTEDEVLSNRVIRSNPENDNVTNIQGTISATVDDVDKEGTYNSDINTSQPTTEFSEIYAVNYMHLNNNLSEVTKDIESEIVTTTLSVPMFIDLTTTDNINHNTSDVGYSYNDLSEPTQSDESTYVTVPYLHESRFEYTVENLTNETGSTVNSNSGFSDSTTNPEGIGHLHRVLPESTTENIYNGLETTAYPDYDILSSTEITEVTDLETSNNVTDSISDNLRNHIESSTNTNTFSPTMVVECSENETVSDVHTDTKQFDSPSENNTVVDNQVLQSDTISFDNKSLSILNIRINSENTDKQTVEIEQSNNTHSQVIQLDISSSSSKKKKCKVENRNDTDDCDTDSDSEDNKDNDDNDDDDDNDSDGD